MAQSPDPSGVLWTTQDRVQSPVLKAGGAKQGSCDLCGILIHVTELTKYLQ